MPCTACIAPDRCVPLDSYNNLCVRRITADEVVAAVREQLGRARTHGGVKAEAHPIP